CAFAWNPLWLFDIVGNAHNDVLMVLLLLAGVWFALKHHPALGVVATTLGTLVKWTSGAVVLLEVARALSGANGSKHSRAEAALSGRWTRFATISTLVLLVSLVLGWPWFATPRALEAITQLGAGRVAI